MLLASTGATNNAISIGGAVTGLAVALVLAWCGARWLIAENDEQSAKARPKAARRSMWSSRLAMAGVAVFIWAVAEAWWMGQGR